MNARADYQIELFLSLPSGRPVPGQKIVVAVDNPVLNKREESILETHISR